jgi:hypothetical protein
MESALFESTLPLGTPDVMRVSRFQRYLRQRGRERDGGPASTRLAQLNPSLMQDLMRFDGQGRESAGPEVLEVLAACVRHARALLIHLQCDERVLPLTVFPVERLVHCPLPVGRLLAWQLPELTVLHVERALLQPPADPGAALAAETGLHTPLAPLLWELALRGGREDLLPEIAGKAAYRIAPGVDLRALQLTGSLATAVARLQRQTTNLREITDWPGFDRGRAMRMLNGLYLQAALIVTRTHPAATNAGWVSGSPR